MPDLWNLLTEIIKMMNILVSGIGGPTPKGIALSLKLANPQIKIIGIDSNIYAAGLYTNFPFDQTYLVANAQQEIDQYWNDIEKIVEKENIDFAFIVPETEVLVWCKKEETSTLPCKSFLPNAEVASFLFDKLKVSKFLEPFGLAPKTLDVNGLGNSELSKLSDELKFPYWVRLNKTAGALGALKINSDDDLINWLRFTNLETDIIASPFLPGRNYACKLLFKDGNLILGATAERIEYLLANASPTKISGMCARGKLLNSEDLISRARKAIELIFNNFNLEINGMFTVDFKENSDGIALITEINIRHVSFTYAFSLGGANFAFETIKLFEEKSHNPQGVFNFKEEFNFIRGVDNDLNLISSSALEEKRNKRLI